MGNRVLFCSRWTLFSQKGNTECESIIHHLYLYFRALKTDCTIHSIIF